MGGTKQSRQLLGAGKNAPGGSGEHVGMRKCGEEEGKCPGDKNYSMGHP